MQAASESEHRGRPGLRWGEWRLGDLLHAADAATAALGPAVDVSSVSAYPPTCIDLLPVVEVAVVTQDQLDAAMAAASEPGDLIVPAVRRRSFQVVTTDVLVHVWVED